MSPERAPSGIKRRGRREQTPLPESSAAAAGSRPHCWDRAPRQLERAPHGGSWADLQGAAWSAAWGRSTPNPPPLALRLPPLSIIFLSQSNEDSISLCRCRLVRDSHGPVLTRAGARRWARAAVRPGCGALERRPWQRQGSTSSSAGAGHPDGGATPGRPSSPVCQPYPISMEPSAEEAAAKCAEPSPAGEDSLSALPDDVLVLILLRLPTRDAVRTSVLSRRWRRVWGLLPELRFSFTEPHGIRGALAASAVPLRYLLVGGLRGAPAESIATWLPAAARCLTGELTLIDMGSAGGESEERGVLELPCFDKATSISLDLGLLALSVAPAGVFARLTELSLIRVRFHGPCELGRAVSSPRCPCLQKLTVKDSRGLDNLAINSESLKLVELRQLRGLRQLTIMAPVLQELIVVSCFSYDQTRQPVANISVPQLESLWWADAYDPSSVHLGKMENLKSLSTIFCVYGPEGFPQNLSCLMLMSRVKVIESLTLGLAYPQEINYYQYLMEDMTILPDITSLHLILNVGGHSCGACTFHILRMSPGTKRLIMDMSSRFILEAQAECPQGCICDQPSNWKTEELKLNCLREVEI